MIKLAFLCIFLVSSGFSHVLAQGVPTARVFDPQTIETVSGQVLQVDLVSMSSGRGRGVHVMLQTDQETIPVHLGPDWYLASQNLKVNEGDTLEVTGSRVQMDGQETIIASKVVKGNQTVILRNPNGVPAWSGSRRK